jgi:malate synthase
MVQEHQEILGKVTSLVERTKSAQALTPADLGSLASQLASQIADHETRELRLVTALA